MTPFRKRNCTSWRDSFNHQTPTSWTLSAPNATTSPPSSHTHKLQLPATGKYLIIILILMFYRCGFVLCAPTGGKCKLSLGTAWRRKGDWSSPRTLQSHEYIQLINIKLSKNLRYTLFLFYVFCSASLLYIKNMNASVYNSIIHNIH